MAICQNQSGRNAFWANYLLGRKKHMLIFSFGYKKARDAFTRLEIRQRFPIHVLNDEGSDVIGLLDLLCHDHLLKSEPAA